MKILSYVFVTLLLAGNASAAGKAKAIFIDPEVETEGLEKEFDVQAPEPSFKSLPDKDERDDFLSGISQVKDWDEWDKDVFYMYLKSKSLDALIKKYPMFTLDELQKLKEKRK